MPRRARMCIAGYPLHVLQRGHNKRPCFAEERDYLLYLALLAESTSMYPCAVHAFVLMTNHVHLLVTPTESQSISRAMKRLNERYAIHFNKKYARTGSVWEGRFKSSVIDSDAYLLCCQRYIELNPVRAGMATHPGDYPWSSYKTNAWGERCDLLTPHGLYMSMGRSDDARRLSYRRFIAAGCSDAEVASIRAATISSTALGSEAFLASLPEEFRRTPKPSGRPKKATSQMEIPLFGKPGTSRF